MKSIKKIAMISILLPILLSSCNESRWGKEKVYNKVHLHYTDDISELEVTKLGNYLVKVGMADAGATGARYQISCPSPHQAYYLKDIIYKEDFDKIYNKQSMTEKLKMDKLYGQIGYGISVEVFDSKPVIYSFCDPDLNELVSFPMQTIE